MTYEDRTCYKCKKHIDMFSRDPPPYRYDTDVWFHEDCFNPFEHYYGLDKPID